MATRTTTAPPAAPTPLPADLVEALRRLKLGHRAPPGPRGAAHRQGATLGTRGGAPHPHRGRVASRDESNLRSRLRGAGFPVTKTLDEFKVAASSVPQATFDYLACLEWMAKAENLCLVGPAGTGKSHYADVRVMPT